MTDSADSAALEGWAIACEASRAFSTFDITRQTAFALTESGRLAAVAEDDGAAVVVWIPEQGWRSLLAEGDPRRELLELYLPISGGHAMRPMTIGHLGQSLDGFIATPSGDSVFVTGPQNILHLHRLRSLCDAVIVGARTVSTDNPRLTVRLVSGSNPLRVVLDRECRLGASYKIFNDGEAPTVRACASGMTAPAAARERGDDIIEVEAHGDDLDLAQLIRHLHERGCFRILVEGGGVTVSAFLEAGLLDRLHIAVAPLLIGDGRPAIRVRPHRRLQDCLRLQPRVYCTGNDILYDCDLRKDTGNMPAVASETVRRIL